MSGVRPSSPRSTGRRGLIALRHALKRILYSNLPAEWQEAIDQRYYSLLLRLGRIDLSGEAELELLHHLVRSGDTVLDIGANLGVYTLRLSELVGPTGQVHSFEPVPRTFRLLDHNVKAHAPYPNVRIHQAAVSDRSGPAILHLPVEGTLEDYYYASLAKDPGTAARAIPVETVALDGWLTLEIGNVAFLKIDTEGAELEVLRGAARILREFGPIIQCETGAWIRRFGHAPADVFDHLRALGYDAFAYREGRLSEIAGPEASPRANYLFLRSDSAGRLAPSLFV